MKKYLAVLISVIVVATVSLALAIPSDSGVISVNEPMSYASAIPDSVNAIFEKSCYPCHSQPGKGMAMSKLNFDKWADYKPEKQADKAQDICKELTKGAMPTKSFRANNPDKVPTDAEVKMICDWAASFGKK